MVIVDTKHDKAYENVSKVKGAEIIGVDRSTIHRWSLKKETKQVYNHFTIYFNCQRLSRRSKPKM